MSATSTTLHYLFEAKPLWTGTIGPAGVSDGVATTIPLSSATGLDSGDAYVVTAGRVDASGAKRSSNLKEVFIGKVSGTDLINCVRGVEGTAQSHAAGTVVEILFTATHWNNLITAWELEHYQTGKHKPQDWISDSDNATITFDLSAGNKHKVTLEGNRTLALSNVSNGHTFVIRLKQDATGSRTVTWFSGISWVDGATPVLTPTANKADTFGFIQTGAGAYDGYVVGQNI